MNFNLKKIIELKKKLTIPERGFIVVLQLTLLS